jgi:RNA polymerase sigma-70 factor (ECF subfamily)
LQWQKRWNALGIGNDLPRDMTTTSTLPGLASLLNDIADQDQDAWRQLDGQLGPRLHRMCLRLTGDAADADDALQNAYLRIAHSARHFVATGTDPDGAALGWTLSLTTRAVFDLMRSSIRRKQRHARASNQPSSNGMEDASAEIERQELSVHLRCALHTLPERQRLPIILHLLEGMPYDDISRELAAPVTTIKVRIHRGLKTLRGRLARSRGDWTLIGVMHAMTCLPPGGIGERIHLEAFPSQVPTVRHRPVSTTLNGILIASACIVATVLVAIIPWRNSIRLQAKPPLQQVVAERSSAYPTGPETTRASPIPPTSQAPLAPEGIAAHMAIARQLLVDAVAHEDFTSLMTSKSGLSGGYSTSNYPSPTRQPRVFYYQNRLGDPKLDPPAVLTMLDHPCSLALDLPDLGQTCRALCQASHVPFSLDLALDQRLIGPESITLVRLVSTGAPMGEVLDFCCNWYGVAWMPIPGGILVMQGDHSPSFPMPPIDYKSLLPSQPRLPTERIAYAGLLTPSSVYLGQIVFPLPQDRAADEQECVLRRSYHGNEIALSTPGTMGGFTYFMYHTSTTPLPLPAVLPATTTVLPKASG